MYSISSASIECEKLTFDVIVDVLRVRVVLSKIRSVHDNSPFWCTVSYSNFERREIGYFWLPRLMPCKWKFLLRAVPRTANAGRHIERPTSPAYSQFAHG